MKYNNKIIIFNYNSTEVAPEIIITDKSNRYLEESSRSLIEKAIAKHWENGTWHFEQIWYGVKTFYVNSLEDFLKGLEI